MIDWISIYQSFFDKLEPACLAIGETMQKLAYLLLVAFIVIKAGFRWPPDYEAMMKPIVVCAILAGCIAEWPDWAGNKGYFARVGQELAQEVKADSYETYCRTVEDFRKGKTSGWSLFTDPVGTLTAAFALILGVLGEFIMGMAKMFQYFFVALSLAFGPVFLALLVFGTTRSIGVNFLTGTIALFLWDLAWSLVDLGTLNLLHSSLKALPGFFGPALGLIFTAGWVILGYTLAPFVIVKTLTSGGNIGSALVKAPLDAAATMASLTLGSAAVLNALKGTSSQAEILPAPPAPPASSHNQTYGSNYPPPPTIYSSLGQRFDPESGHQAKAGDFTHSGSVLLTQREQNGEDFIETISDTGRSTFTPGNLSNPSDVRMASVAANQAEITAARNLSQSIARGQFDQEQLYS
jgi:hypothetical protein